MSRENLSGDSLIKATKSKAKLTDHDGGLGAAGVTDAITSEAQSMLDKNGESEVISPPEGGFKDMHVGLAWNNIIVEKADGFMGLLKKTMNKGVDLDLGCFFEMADGTRGVLQPFGELFGNYDEIPYIKLSGDERTGDAEGDDEYFTIKGAQWSEIKRILVYTYIYQGSNDWSQIKPELTVNLNLDGEPPLKVSPALKTNDLTVCALVTIENVKNGIRIKTHGEYFASQAAMDRAFGFGLKWEDGAKN